MRVSSPISFGSYRWAIRPARRQPPGRAPSSEMPSGPPAPTVDRDDRRQAVAPTVSEEDVGKRPQPASRAHDVDSRPDAARGGGLVRWRCSRDRAPDHGRLTRASAVRPGDDALDLHGDQDPVGVVGAQPAIPEQAGLRRTHEPSRRRSQRFQRRPVGVGVVTRLALHEHEARLVGKAMLAGVIGERHVRVLVDPLELLAEPERGREADGAGSSVAQADRRHRRHDGAFRRGQICERSCEVASDYRVVGIGPVRHRNGRPCSVFAAADGAARSYAR